MLGGGANSILILRSNYSDPLITFRNSWIWTRFWIGDSLDTSYLYQSKSDAGDLPRLWHEP